MQPSHHAPKLTFLRAELQEFMWLFYVNAISCNVRSHGKYAPVKSCPILLFRLVLSKIVALLVQFSQEKHQCENAARQVFLTSEEFGASRVRITIPFSKANILASSTTARSLSGLLINSWRTSAVAMTVGLKRGGWVSAQQNGRTIFICS